jgi:hypothetical protein
VTSPERLLGPIGLSSQLAALLAPGDCICVIHASPDWIEFMTSAAGGELG